MLGYEGGKGPKWPNIIFC